MSGGGQLLLEDYVKWKGSLFFQYIVALSDPEEDIQVTAAARLQTAVLQKVRAGANRAHPPTHPAHRFLTEPTHTLPPTHPLTHPPPPPLCICVSVGSPRC